MQLIMKASVQCQMREEKSSSNLGTSESTSEFSKALSEQTSLAEALLRGSASSLWHTENTFKMTMWGSSGHFY